MLIIQIKCTAFRPSVVRYGEEKRCSAQLCCALILDQSREVAGEEISQELGAGFLCMASWVAVQVFIHLLSRRLTPL